MSPAAIERFWSYVSGRESMSPGACWLWKGPKRSGYGSASDGPRREIAHRVAYRELCGPIPEGMGLDHLCRVKMCVNPAHLECVTQGENIRRGNRARKALTGHGPDEKFAYCTVKFPERLMEAVNKGAATEGITRSELVRRAVSESIARALGQPAEALPWRSPRMAKPKPAEPRA